MDEGIKNHLPVWKVVFEKEGGFLRSRFACAGGEVVAVELGDVVCTDFFRADCFTLEVVGAVSEAFGVHLIDHGDGALVFLDLALGKVVEVGGFRGDEEHRRRVLTGGDTGTAADAGSGIEGRIGICLRNGKSVGIRC